MYTQVNLVIHNLDNMSTSSPSYNHDVMLSLYSKKKPHRCSCVRASVMSDSLPARVLCPWDSPGKNTGVGCQALLQGIFPTQGSNPCLLCLLHWQGGSLSLAPPRKPMKMVPFVNYLMVPGKFPPSEDPSKITLSKIPCHHYVSILRYLLSTLCQIEGYQMNVVP